MSMKEIYRKRITWSRPFIASNYKKALAMLEEDGKITTDPPKEARIRGFADNVKVTFPPKSRS